MHHVDNLDSGSTALGEHEPQQPRELFGAPTGVPPVEDRGQRVDTHPEASATVTVVSSHVADGHPQRKELPMALCHLGLLGRPTDSTLLLHPSGRAVYGGGLGGGSEAIKVAMHRRRDTSAAHTAHHSLFGVLVSRGADKVAMEPSSWHHPGALPVALLVEWRVSPRC